jgi:hypothetical protein
VSALTAGRTKLSLSRIAAGKTDAIKESHFGDVGCHRTNHSESGRATTDTLRRRLTRLRSIYDNGGPLGIILDCYTVHRQEEMKCNATELEINLLILPPGLADKLQLLDSFAFGVMKANCHRLYRPHAEGLGVMNKQIANASLVRA